MLILLRQPLRTPLRNTSPASWLVFRYFGRNDVGRTVGISIGGLILLLVVVAIIF